MAAPYPARHIICVWRGWDLTNLTTIINIMRPTDTEKQPEKKPEKKEITLTTGQEKAFNQLKSFVADPSAKVFILKGYAGTGKTTLMRLFIEELTKQNVAFSLLASTGRAAKVLANITQKDTFTVHSKIYRFSQLSHDLEQLAKQQEHTIADESGQLYLNFELMPCDDKREGIEHIYIIDEASMVSDVKDRNATQATFGSGRLLHDLLEYDKQGKFIFVGDVCQLPPITQNFSPALDTNYFLRAYGIKANECELTQIMRQSGDNDIILSAQKLRKLYQTPPLYQKWAKFPLKGYANIHILNSHAELINRYVESIRQGGFNSSTMLCLSNKQSTESTRILRPIFGHHGQQLERGDLLLVTQNNLISGLMNGDLVVVESIGAQYRRADLNFVKVRVRELFTGFSHTQLLISDVLYSNNTNISQIDHKALYIDFYYRMKEKDIKQDSDMFYSKMRDDPYLNALRAVFGYVLTCHKSQGGEWDNVFIDIPRNLPYLPKPYVYQWLYTAVTRAKKELYLVYDYWVI